MAEKAEQLSSSNHNNAGHTTKKHSPDANSLYRSCVSAYQKGDFKTALEFVLKAISINSNVAEFYNTFGVILVRLGNEEGATKAYRKAIELNSNYADAYSNLGNRLQKQNKHKESIKCYEKAIALNPKHAAAYNNLSSVLYRFGNFKGVIQNCMKAIELKSDYAEAYNTLAGALQMELKFDEAIENYNMAIKYAPDYAEAHRTLGMLYLNRGEFSKGWEGFQWRLRTDESKAKLRYDKPWWQGENFEGKRLLVQFEQGFGDSIQFVRYLPMVKERGGTVIFAERQELVNLFRNSDGIDEFVSPADIIEGKAEYDLYVPLLSLPRIFDTTIENIPADIPYIRTGKISSQGQQGAFNTRNFRVGIVWAGASHHKNDYNRSCCLKEFEELVQIEGIDFYSFQKGPPEAELKEFALKEKIKNIGKLFKDFFDTAAALEDIDLLISVDTSVLHLAGAMGKEVWGLIEFHGDWRWMLERDDSPWYPTLRLFRQKTVNGWPDVLSGVSEELKKTVAKHKSEL